MNKFRILGVIAIIAIIANFFGGLDAVGSYVIIDILCQCFDDTCYNDGCTNEAYPENITGIEQVFFTDRKYQSDETIKSAQGDQTKGYGYYSHN